MTCAWCGHFHSETGICTDGTPPREPMTGDYCLCIKCLRVSIYTTDMGLRKPTPNEAMEIWEDPLITKLIVSAKNYGL